MYSKSLPELVSQFVSYKKANGYQYETGAYYLKKYVRFVMETAPETAVPDKASVEGFLERLQDTPGGLYNAAAFLREFSRYLHARGLKAYLIPSGRLHPPTPAQPYFFTEDEIIAFFMECDRMPDTPYLKGRHLILPAIFRLMYCCGLRCKEARTLARQNVHLDQGYLDVLQSKGPKSRRVYISQELTEYLAGYDSRISRLFPDRTFFFPNRKGRPYGACWLERNFLRFWYTAFPEKKDSGISIRAYDFPTSLCLCQHEPLAAGGEGRKRHAPLPYAVYGAFRDQKYPVLFPSCAGYLWRDPGDVRAFGRADTGGG